MPEQEKQLCPVCEQPLEAYNHSYCRKVIFEIDRTTHDPEVIKQISEGNVLLDGYSPAFIDSLDKVIEYNFSGVDDAADLEIKRFYKQFLDPDFVRASIKKCDAFPESSFRIKKDDPRSLSCLFFRNK